MSKYATSVMEAKLNALEIGASPHLNGWRIYMNLNQSKIKENIIVWSVECYIPKKGWRVIGHLKDITASQVTFKVYEAGRNRAVRDKRRNVHAYAIAEDIYPMTEWQIKAKRDGPWMLGTYNPFRSPHFSIVTNHDQHLDDRKISWTLFTGDNRHFYII